MTFSNNNLTMTTDASGDYSTTIATDAGDRLHRIAIDGDTYTLDVDEVQTLTISAGAQGDTFKLTYNAHEAATAVTLDSGGDASAAAVQACVDSISDFATDKPVVAKTGTKVFTITFSAGALAHTDVGAITMTSKTGAANGSIAETTKGVSGTTFSIKDNNGAGSELLSAANRRHGYSAGSRIRQAFGSGYDSAAPTTPIKVTVAAGGNVKTGKATIVIRQR